LKRHETTCEKKNSIKTNDSNIQVLIKVVKDQNKIIKAQNKKMEELEKKKREQENRARKEKERTRRKDRIMCSKESNQNKKNLVKI